MQISTLREALGTPKVIRAMPNLPAQIGMGMTAFTSTDEVTRAELVQVQNLLSTTGKTVYVEEESAIDASTAISGSGPAYVYYCMEALMAAAAQMGFAPAEAELLVSQTFRGAVELYSQAGLSCQDWIARVASKVAPPRPRCGPSAPGRCARASWPGPPPPATAPKSWVRGRYKPIFANPHASSS